MGWETPLERPPGGSFEGTPPGMGLGDPLMGLGDPSERTPPHLFGGVRGAPRGREPLFGVGVPIWGRGGPSGGVFWGLGPRDWDRDPPPRNLGPMRGQSRGFPPNWGTLESGGGAQNGGSFIIGVPHFGGAPIGMLRGSRTTGIPHYWGPSLRGLSFLGSLIFGVSPCGHPPFIWVLHYGNPPLLGSLVIGVSCY